MRIENKFCRYQQIMFQVIVCNKYGKNEKIF